MFPIPKSMFLPHFQEENSFSPFSRRKFPMQETKYKKV
jgi:hypothetical protein